MNSSIWTDQPEMVDALKAHHAAKLSASMIAQRLNDRFGTDFTRNSIIGKLNRLGLTSTDKTRQQANPRRQAHHQVAAINRAIADKPLPFIEPETDNPDYREPIDPHTFAVTFGELEAPHCRWPLGEAPFTYCGAQKQFSSPYCGKHHRIAYTKPRAPIFSDAEIERRRQMAQRNFRQMRASA